MKDFTLITGATMKEQSGSLSKTIEDIRDVFNIPDNFTDEAIDLLREIYVGNMVHEFYVKGEELGAIDTRFIVTWDIDESGTINLVSSICGVDEDNQIINELHFSKKSVGVSSALNISPIIDEFNREIIPIIATHAKCVITYLDYIEFARNGGSYYV